MITKGLTPVSGAKSFVIMVTDTWDTGPAGARGSEGRADVRVNGLGGGFAGNLRAQEPLPRLR
jgi:hypothetical protein